MLKKSLRSLKRQMIHQKGLILSLRRQISRDSPLFFLQDIDPFRALPEAKGIYMMLDLRYQLYLLWPCGKH